MTNQPLQFRQPSLRETIVDALAFIGVQDYSDFDLKEEFFNNPERGIHDARHLYRVMIAAALIAKKLNEPRRGLLAFCGAFLHDQARNHNGDDPGHDPRAAQTKWEMHRALWEKYQLTPCSAPSSARPKPSGASPRTSPPSSPSGTSSRTSDSPHTAFFPLAPLAI